ncbi:cysteine synthase A [Flammeovirga pectinis]|uniref:Cysteine synthase n=1 Tax=Flammeovirga pectinis TaxID=2494373 RepID=A0A3S9PA82_9BACT|nr:cysteine synthase A [Flammeovirga pectinis]AZQ65110.1 cysteine synthase A [Flammeovirga pectinis]
MIYNSILDTIGQTPIIKINKLFSNKHNVFIKAERFNPASSIKDRIALAMIEKAEEDGLLNKDSEIIEPTSGNTGVGLSMVAAVKGYSITLCMPESMSIERRKLMASYGAKLVLTPKEKGMKGAIAKAEELAEGNKNAWIPSQFDNPANVNIHATTTAQEIIEDFPNGLDYLITGVGTGGHITGVAKVLKEKWPNIKVFAVEPEVSAVIGGGAPGPHPLQGIGAGFIPKNLDTSLLDGAIGVDAEKSKAFARELALKEGFLGGISTGASLAAVDKKLAEIPEGSSILTFNYDTGERYLSIEGLFGV